MNEPNAEASRWLEQAEDRTRYPNALVENTPRQAFMRSQDKRARGTLWVPLGSVKSGSVSNFLIGGQVLFTLAVIVLSFCLAEPENGPTPGIVIEGMVCVGDGYSSEPAASASDLAKKCIGPIPGAEVSMTRGFSTETDAAGRFKLGPIPHEALSHAVIGVLSHDFSGFRGLPTSRIITSAMEQSGHAWILCTLPDGTGDFQDFRAFPPSTASEVKESAAPTAELWSSGGIALRDSLQRAVNDLSVSDLSGRHWDKSALRGKITLIEFWGKWCGPCRVDLPHINDAIAKFGQRGFQALGIAILEKDSREFQKWSTEHGLNWPQVVTADGYDGPIMKRFAVRRVPTSILVGRDGRVLGADLRARRLMPVLAGLLAAVPPA